MSEYTPTTADIGRAYYLHACSQDWEGGHAAEFNRWLAAHDSEVRTAALEEAAVIADAIGLKRKSNACLEVVEAIRAAKVGD